MEIKVEIKKMDNGKNGGYVITAEGKLGPQTLNVEATIDTGIASLDAEVLKAMVASGIMKG